MNPLKLLLEELARTHQELTTRANKAIAGLGDIEKYQVAGNVTSALRELEWLGNRLEDLGNVWAERVGEVEGYVSAYDGSTIAAAITAGTVIKKEDHDTLITAAEEKGKTEAETAFRAEQQRVAAAQARRTALAEEIGVTAANALALEDLTAADVEDRVTAFKGRVTALKDAKMDPEKFSAAYVDLLASCPLTEDGQKQFDKRLDAFRPLLTATPAAPAKPGDEHQEKPPGEVRAEGEGGKKTMRF
jgi:hypothetical protein